MRAKDEKGSGWKEKREEVSGEDSLSIDARLEPRGRGNARLYTEYSSGLSDTGIVPVIVLLKVRVKSSHAGAAGRSTRTPRILPPCIRLL